jgi:hypothetical protein
MKIKIKREKKEKENEKKEIMRTVLRCSRPWRVAALRRVTPRLDAPQKLEFFHSLHHINLWTYACNIKCR